MRQLNSMRLISNKMAALGLGLGLLVGPLGGCSSPEWKAEVKAEKETLCRDRCLKESAADINALRACSYHCHSTTRVKDRD